MRGEDANLLSLGAVDFGIVVDSAVILVENIFRVFQASEREELLRGAARLSNGSNDESLAVIESMFPNQVRAIVVESGAVKLDLSEKPDVPSSSPLRVDVCRNQQCRTYITFSGQRIRVNTESWDVLSDGVGHVLVVGRNVAWTSAEPNHRSGAYHIDAEQLGSSS